MKICKYFSEESAKHFLENSTIRISQPKIYNDPFELNPRLTQSPISMKYIASFDLDPTRTKSLYKKYLIDCCEQKSYLYDGTHNLINKLNDLIGFSCFSRYKEILPQNLLMWSHYGESHKGISVEFKDNAKLLINSKPVRYYKYRPIIDETIFEKEEWIPISDFYFKSNVWSYEKEIRIVRHLHTCKNIGNDKFGNPIYIENVDPSDVNCIFVGYNANEQIRDLAKNFCAKHTIKYVALTLDTNCYKLVVDEFSSNHDIKELNTFNKILLIDSMK